MRILIAGVGSVGQRHLQNLMAAGEHDFMLFRTGRGALKVNNLPPCIVESDLSRALAHRPEVAIISTPTALHLDMAVPCAEAGCHLLIEKPVSHSLDGIDALRRAVALGGGKVLVGFQFRFHPLLQTLRELVQAGRLGKPRWAMAHWGHFLPEWHGWEDHRTSYAARRDLGGGVTLTLCHPFDYLIWILGPLECVASRIRNLGALDVDVDDFADVWLTGRDGLTVSVHLDYYQRPMQHRVSVGGELGNLTLDFVAGSLTGAVDGVAVDVRVPSSFGRNDMFVSEIQHFLNVCRGQEPPMCTLDEGLASLHLALAARDLDPHSTFGGVGQRRGWHTGETA